jgi:DNA-directed RNA polymerase subunit RPC12/RpoP
MKIICLGCGHKIDLLDAYDDYSGPVKCSTCGTILHVITELGYLKAMEVLAGHDESASVLSSMLARGAVV